MTYLLLKHADRQEILGSHSDENASMIDEVEQHMSVSRVLSSFEIFLKRTDSLQSLENWMHFVPVWRVVSCITGKNFAENPESIRINIPKTHTHSAECSNVRTNTPLSPLYIESGLLPTRALKLKLDNSNSLSGSKSRLILIETGNSIRWAATRSAKLPSLCKPTHQIPKPWSNLSKIYWRRQKENAGRYRQMWQCLEVPKSTWINPILQSHTTSPFIACMHPLSGDIRFRLGSHKPPIEKAGRSVW